MQVLLAPQISEKATYVADKHEQVVFRVASDATKPEIKAAVELLFKVEVEGVQVANVKGKVKRFKGRDRSSQGLEEAFVSLKPGRKSISSRGVTRNGSRQSKPTSPGRRAVVQVVNPDLHKGKPFAGLVESQSKNSVATTMVASLFVIKVAVTSRLIADRFQRNKDGIPPRSSAWSTIRTARPNRPGLLRRWRASLHHCNKGMVVGQQI
jgi:large subunit ribosomal protein L23